MLVIFIKKKSFCFRCILRSYLFVTRVEIHLGEGLKMFSVLYSRMPGLFSVHLIFTFFFEIIWLADLKPFSSNFSNITFGKKNMSIHIYTNINSTLHLYHYMRNVLLYLHFSYKRTWRRYTQIFQYCPTSKS